MCYYYYYYIAAKYSEFFGVTPIFRAYSDNPIFSRKLRFFKFWKIFFPQLLLTCIIYIVMQTFFFFFLQYFNLLISDYYFQLFSILYSRCLFPISNCFARASTINSVTDGRCYLWTNDLMNSSYCHSHSSFAGPGQIWVSGQDRTRADIY